jgi:SAM-dependent methyltransferase
LVIGDAFGRDSDFLTSLGFKIRQLDLSPQESVADLVVQSIEDQTPFAQASFDGVVMNEVLEHLYRDLDALQEVRRILKPDGVLVLTTPLARRQDRAEFHVRIHTQRTLRRLLAASGFLVEEEFMRGFLTRITTANRACRGVVLTAQIAHRLITGGSKATAIRRVNSAIAATERRIGSSFLGQRVQACFITYGAIVKARPNAPIDSSEIQRKHFTNRGLGNSTGPSFSARFGNCGDGSRKS